MLKAFWGFQWLCQYIDVLEIQFNLLFWISFCLATCLSLKKSTYIFYTKLKTYHGKVYMILPQETKSLAELERALAGATLTSSHSSIRYTRPVWGLEYGSLSEYFCMPLSYIPCPLPLPKTEILHPTLIFILRMDTISNYLKNQILNWSQLQYCRILHVSGSQCKDGV